MRKKIVAGNWKMNLSFEEGQQLTSELVNMYQDEAIKDVVVVLNPPFPHLYPVQRLVGYTAGIFWEHKTVLTKMGEPSLGRCPPRFWLLLEYRM